MLVKLLAIVIILVGIAGLILPIIPGIFLISLGFLLLYRENHEEISRLINEKAPAVISDLYNNFVHTIITPRYYIGVDWHWVKAEILRTEKSPGIPLMLNECMRKARSLTHTKYIYAEKKISRLDTGSIELEDGTIFSTQKIPAYITGATGLVLFLVTIGDRVEKEAGSLISGDDPVKGYLLDRIGSFAVESIADKLEHRLRKDYSLIKKSVSSRFSPGYCDWPVEEQFKMAKSLDFSKAGVTLTDGCMMVPKKSISAIAAVADEGVFKDFISSCNICEQEDCSYRRGN